MGRDNKIKRKHPQGILYSIQNQGLIYTHNVSVSKNTPDMYTRSSTFRYTFGMAGIRDLAHCEYRQNFQKLENMKRIEKSPEEISAHITENKYPTIKFETPPAPIRDRYCSVPDDGILAEEAKKFETPLAERRSSEDKLSCHCRFSGCLKLYCICFAANQVCDRDCRCDRDRCKNAYDQRERQLALLINSSKKSKHSVDTEGISCTCKKCRCLKLYCECFSIGERCNSLCTCLGCKNMSP